MINDGLIYADSFATLQVCNNGSIYFGIFLIWLTKQASIPIFVNPFLSNINSENTDMWYGFGCKEYRCLAFPTGLNNKKTTAFILSKFILRFQGLWPRSIKIHFSYEADINTRWILVYIFASWNLLIAVYV